MSIISKETFDKFTKEEKEKLRYDYDGLIYLSEHSTDIFLRNEAPKTIREYERLFGKENLQPPEPKIKTWEDINKMDNRYHKLIDEIIRSGYSSLWDSKVINKVIATLKISKLIELAYGGMVTEEEWKDKTIPKYCIVPNWLNKGFHRIKCETIDEMRFIGFHTYQQADEFISYIENIEIVEQYYMI